MRSIIVSLMFIVLTSCSLKQRIEKFCPNCPLKEKDSITYIESIRDSIIYIDNSEAISEILMQCDSLNQISITEINELKSKGVKVVTKFKDNKIYIQASIDSTAVYMSLRDRFKSNSKIETITVREKYIPNIFWVLGGICLILAFILGFYIHKFISIKNLL